MKLVINECTDVITYVPLDASAVVITGKPVAITVIAISPFILSSTNAPKIIFALGSTAS